MNKPIKAVDDFTYVGGKINSTEKDAKIRYQLVVFICFGRRSFINLKKKKNKKKKKKNKTKKKQNKTKQKTDKKLETRLLIEIRSCLS